MKKEKKDYIGLSLKIAGISFIIMFIAMYLGSVTNEIHRGVVFGSYGVLRLSLIYFFVSVIYNQFRDKRILWGIVNIIFLIVYLANYGKYEDVDFVAIVIVFISCLWYYFFKIKQRFTKKNKYKLTDSKTTTFSN